MNWSSDRLEPTSLYLWVKRGSVGELSRRGRSMRAALAAKARGDGIPCRCRYLVTSSGKDWRALIGKPVGCRPSYRAGTYIQYPLLRTLVQAQSDVDFARAHKIPLSPAIRSFGVVITRLYPGFWGRVVSRAFPFMSP